MTDKLDIEGEISFSLGGLKISAAKKGETLALHLTPEPAPQPQAPRAKRAHNKGKAKK